MVESVAMRKSENRHEMRTQDDRRVTCCKCAAGAILSCAGVAGPAFCIRA